MNIPVPNEPGINTLSTRLQQNIDYENGLLNDHDNESIGAQSHDTEGENVLRPFFTFREWLLKVLHSTRYQVC